MKTKCVLMAAMASVVFFWGCVMSVDETSKAVGNAVGGEVDAGFQSDEASNHSQKDEDAGIVSLKVIGHAGGKIGDFHQANDDQSQIPNRLDLATCDSKPIEIAVPLNVSDEKSCDVVTAAAMRITAADSYNVNADYSWEIADESIAMIPEPFYPGSDSIRRPVAMYDLFSPQGNGSFEPHTVLTVCALPPDASGIWFEPLCRGIPVQNVVNIEGAWCFSGKTFDAYCTDLQILQDGRDLYIGSSNMPRGRVFSRDVRFGHGVYEYEGVLDSGDSMYGIVMMVGSDEVLGTWSAWRLPLF